MNIEKCRECKHHTCYYHGFGVGSITFSHRCWWNIVNAEKVKEDNCHFERKEEVKQ